ncbi:MAG: sugar phosphate isomerase/epimerase [Armatimonadetes bacterium]|nr:sugar phosphate isomerase/epimerase [Armatimonadota bacterium]
MPTIPVSLQTYTVRNVLADDFVGVVKQIAEMGYAGIEIGGNLGGMSPGEFRSFVGDLGLALTGNHVGIDALESNLSQVIDENLAIGNRWIVCPWMPEDRRQDAAGWRTVAGLLSEIGAKVKAAGLQLCYHNHSFEFQRFDGQTGFDIFYAAADPDLVQAEIDTYWVQHGGDDPAATIERFAGRVPLVHLKDMTPGDSPTFTEVGNGILDFPAIFAASERAGVEWYIVEQDTCAGPSLERARISFDNLRKWGIA